MGFKCETCGKIYGMAALRACSCNLNRRRSRSYNSALGPKPTPKPESKPKFMPFELDKKMNVRLITDKEIICINNAGMEESFDQGISYIVESHPDHDMVWAYDKFGVKQEVFAERFEKGYEFNLGAKGIHLHHKDKIK